MRLTASWVSHCAPAQLVHGQAVVDGGVADQDIDAAQLGAGQARGALPGVLLGHVTLDREGGRACGAQPGGDGASFRRPGRRRTRPALLGREPLGGGASDAGGGTGDDRGLAGEAAGLSPLGDGAVRMTPDGIAPPVPLVARSLTYSSLTSMPRPGPAGMET